jgi:colanic acid biosynthesis glycosyl transferase WcaI
MKIQLWSYNYAPEPTGIGPVSRTWAEAMAELGHEVTVVAAHAHYPEPVWGKSKKPTREVIGGIDVIRLPLWIGRESTLARIRQDASFSAGLLAALPMLPTADVRVVVSPCFPALSCAITAKKIDRTPWMLWVQDILPDGAMDTGLVADEGKIVKMSRKLELAAYRSADRIAVISDNFEKNLSAKGVPAEKLTRIYNPATVEIADRPRSDFSAPPRILVMGNIGHSQGLLEVVREFEASERLEQLGAKLIITGTGVAAEELRASIKTDRVEMLGLVSADRLREELQTASLGLVSQISTLPEFNFPSKLMNYLASALPVIASVGENSEVGSVINASGAGWIADNTQPGQLAETIVNALESPLELEIASAAAHRFAVENLSANALAYSFDMQIREMLDETVVPSTVERVPVEQEQPVAADEQEVSVEAEITHLPTSRQRRRDDVPQEARIASRR